MKINAPAHLQIEDLTVAYNAHPALESVSFEVPEGLHVAVVGPNGAGKSTLFKTLVGLLPIRRGRILIHGEPLGSHRECVAYVPQREEVDWRFPVTVEDVVMMGRYGQLGWLRRPGKRDREVVARVLEQMGMRAYASGPIGDLSGGQQQRVFLARALAQEPHILLMDEPFTGVDATTQEATLALLNELRAQGVTLMVSTHDLNLAARHFKRVLLLNRRLIAYGAPEEVFMPEPIMRAFGAQVMMLPGRAGTNEAGEGQAVVGAVVIDQCCPPDEHVASFTNPDESELYGVSR